MQSWLIILKSFSWIWLMWLFNVVVDCEIPNQWAVGEIRNYKWINDKFSLFKYHKRWSYQRIDFVRLFFKRKVNQHFSKHALENCLLQISNSMIFLSLRRRWNLSGFTFIQLMWKEKERLSVAVLTLLITFSSKLQIECYHLHNYLSQRLMLERVSQRNTLKRREPNMEPCGTPCSIFVQLLNILFIFIFCFRWLK